MKVSKTLCDLCRTEQQEVATLSVPPLWLPEKKHKVPESEKHLFLSQMMWAQGGWGGPVNPSFDICRGCTEALLNSAMWLKSVTEASHE